MDFASIAPYIKIALSFALGVLAGPYVSGYARKKGEVLCEAAKRLTEIEEALLGLKH